MNGYKQRAGLGDYQFCMSVSTASDITRFGKGDRTRLVIGIYNEPKEIAEMICFLLSDKASYATGQDFLIDGGYVIGK